MPLFRIRYSKIEYSFDDNSIILSPRFTCLVVVSTLKSAISKILPVTFSFTRSIALILADSTAKEKGFVGFRVSPEEAYALDLKVNASGMTKQDYCTKKVLDEEITVHPNIRVQTYICRYLTELTEQLKRLESIEKNNDVLENIKYLLELIDKMGEN